MKKLGVFLIILGIVLYAAAVLLSVTVRDSEDIRRLSYNTGIVIIPENAESLLQQPQANELSGTSSWMLSLYRHVNIISSAGVGCACIGLFLIILSLIFKPLLSIVLLLLIAWVCYFAYQGNLGPEVQHFMQGVFTNMQQLFLKAVDWIKSAPQMKLM